MGEALSLVVADEEGVAVHEPLDPELYVHRALQAEEPRDVHRQYAGRLPDVVFICSVRKGTVRK